MTGEPPATVAPAALHHELTHEWIQRAHRINLVRLWGVSAFLLPFVLLGGMLHLPAWRGNLHLFAIYRPVTAPGAPRRSGRGRIRRAARGDGVVAEAGVPGPSRSAPAATAAGSVSQSPRSHKEASL